jgi:hypothetical protein
MKWTQEVVETKLRNTIGFDTFISQRKAYLPVNLDGLDILVYRDDFGVSFWLPYPIMSIDDAQRFNDFVQIAFPFLYNLTIT